jgi:hypothetical protein
MLVGHPALWIVIQTFFTSRAGRLFFGQLLLQEDGCSVECGIASSSAGSMSVRLCPGIH